MKLTHIGHSIRALRRVETLIIGPPHELNPHQRALLAQYGQMRTDYVMQEGWPIHASGIDVDTYDTAADSYYVMAHAGHAIVAGMRLTNVSSPWGSLSYSMWHRAIDRPKFNASLRKAATQMADIDRVASKGHLWDVTRLISASALGFETNARFRAESRIGVMMVMAAAVSITDEPSSYWIFTASAKAYRFMERNHFSPHVLAKGMISATDKEETYFCYLNPHDVIRELERKNPLVHRIAKKTINTHKKR